MHIIVETFLNTGEPSNAIYRVRPIPGQIHSASMRVQCSRAMRSSEPLGTRFRLKVQLVSPPHREPFLRHNESDAWEVVERPPKNK